MNVTKPEICLFLEVIPTEESFWVLFSAIFTSVVNLITMLAAVICNGILLYIFWKYERLHVPSNVFVGSLCLSDFITGLIVQPLSVVRRLNEVYGRHLCDVRIVCAYFFVFCCSISLMSIGLISIDRCLAITLPFRYRKFAHNSHFIKAVALLWFVWAILTLLPFLGLLTATVSFHITFTVMGSTTIVILIAYCLIVRILRNHRRKIGFMQTLNHPEAETAKRVRAYSFLPSLPKLNGNNNNRVTTMVTDAKTPRVPKRKSGVENLQVPLMKLDNTSVICENNQWNGPPSMTGTAASNSACSTFQSNSTCSPKRPRRPARRSMREFATNLVNHSLTVHSTQRNGANTIAIVIVFLIICYLPQTVLLLVRGLHGDSVDIIYIVDPWTDMLLFMNGCINPIIYCFRSKEIQDCIRMIMKRKQDSWQIEMES